MNGNTGWRTLAEPTYGVSMLGDAYRLPAGLPCRLPKGFDSGLTGTVVLETDVPEVDLCGYIPPTLWFVTASALRFEETA